jgi:hypothetical protein
MRYPPRGKRGKSSADASLSRKIKHDHECLKLDHLRLDTGQGVKPESQCFATLSSRTVVPPQ